MWVQTKKFSQRVLRARWGNTQPNITATSLADDYVHFCQPRALTVREWARLQMFPDWYEFAGKRTTGGLRRAGNPLGYVWLSEKTGCPVIRASISGADKSRLFALEGKELWPKIRLTI